MVTIGNYYEKGMDSIALIHAKVSLGKQFISTKKGCCSFLCAFLINLFINQPLKADDNIVDGHQFVDLGLPSGTMWATCNIGATTPLNYGTFIAWGEIDPKNNTDYTVTKYKFNKGAERPTPQRPAVISPRNFTWKLTKYSYSLDKKLVLDDADDVAKAKWGTKWMIPTKEQFEELRNNCKWTYDYFNGVFCWKVTGSNGNSILFPTSGHYSVIPGDGVSKNIYRNKRGFYWSRNLSDSYDTDAWCMWMSNDGRYSISRNSREYGCSIRPVLTKSTSDSIVNSKNELLMQILNNNRNLAKDSATAYFPFSVCTYCVIHSDKDDYQEKLYNKIIKSYPDLRYSKSLDDAAASGDTDALFLLGYCYFRGLGVSTNRDESRKCFLKAAEKDDGRSVVMLFALGLADYADKTCLDILKKVASENYPPAVVLDAYIEFSLRFTSILSKSKQELFEEKILPAVNMNYPEAEYLHGNYCNNLTSISLAASDGYIYAANRAATIYAERKEYNKALVYASISKQDANYEVKGPLLQEIQIGCDKPKEIAKGMYQAYLGNNYNVVEYAYSRAKAKKLATADIEVIMALRIRAKGDNSSCSLANQKLTEYAEQGNVLAQEELAWSYEKGLGMSSPDMATAFSWYRKAAKNGSKKAQNYLKNRNLNW